MVVAIVGDSDDISEFNKLKAANEANGKNLKIAVQAWLKNHKGLGISFSTFFKLNAKPTLKRESTNGWPMSLFKLKRKTAKKSGVSYEIGFVG
jgi:hypothetical protein